MRSPASSDAAADTTTRGRDNGQAAVELALCLPLLFMFLLGIVQLVVIVRDQLAVQLAAPRGGARRGCRRLIGRVRRSGAAIAPSACAR